MIKRTPVPVAGVAGAGAGVLYLLQPLPAFFMGASMLEEPSFHPSWLSISWIAAALVFGVSLAASIYFIGRQPARTIVSVLVSTALYLAVASGSVLVGSPDPSQAVNYASALTLLAFTYYLNGWVAVILAAAVAGTVVRIERNASSRLKLDERAPLAPVP